MSLLAPAQTGTRPYRFTPADYFHLSEIGFFAGRRVELIGGRIMEVAAQSNQHLATIRRVERRLEAAFGTGYWVRAQGSLDLSPLGVPDPDIAVVRGDPNNPGPNLPTDALLVAEISDSTLSYDRGDKASMYAAAGIRDYWVVNVPDGQIEVFRDFVADPAAPFGTRYETVTILKAGDTVSPLAAPQTSIPVADLLP